MKKKTLKPETGSNENHIAYRALANDLRKAILDGKFLAGKQLPTEAELAAERGISRQTVRQAYAELVAEDLVYRVRGRGSFVTPQGRQGSYLRSFGSVDDLLALSLDTEMTVIKPLERRADVAAAGRLHLSSDEIMAMTFLRLHAGSVFCHTATYLPVEIGSRIESEDFVSTRNAKSRETIIDLIERRASVPIAGAQQSITATALPSDLAPLLECEQGEPVLRIDRVYFDQEGNHLELAVSHLNPLRYSYRLELRRGTGPGQGLRPDIP